MKVQEKPVTGPSTRLREMLDDPAVAARAKYVQLLFEMIQDLKRQEVSYEKLAQSMGRSRAQVSKIFQGDHMSSLATLEMLARALGGSLEVRYVPRTSSAGRGGPSPEAVSKAVPRLSESADEPENKGMVSFAG